MSENDVQKRTKPFVLGGHVYDDAHIHAEYLQNKDIVAVSIDTDDGRGVVTLYMTPAAARQLVRRIGDAFIREAIETGAQGMSELIDLMDEMDMAARNWRDAGYRKGMAVRMRSKDWLKADEAEERAYQAYNAARYALRNAIGAKS